MEEGEPSRTPRGVQAGATTVEAGPEVLRKSYTEPPSDPAIPLGGIRPREMKTSVPPSKSAAALGIVAETQTRPARPSPADRVNNTALPTRREGIWPQED